MTLMPWRLVKSVMAKVRVQEKMEMEREGKKGKEKKKGQAKIATAAERVAKAVTAKTGAPSAGKQAV